MKPRLSHRLTFLVEHLDLPAATGDPEATWETFQLGFLSSSAQLGIDVKGRQIGWSWTAARAFQAAYQPGHYPWDRWLDWGGPWVWQMWFDNPRGDPFWNTWSQIFYVLTVVLFLGNFFFIR